MPGRFKCSLLRGMSVERVFCSVRYLYMSVVAFRALLKNPRKVWLIATCWYSFVGVPYQGKFWFIFEEFRFLCVFRVERHRNLNY